MSVPLTRGQTSLVDVRDFFKVAWLNWCALWVPGAKCFYAVRSVQINKRTRLLYLHRELLGITGTSIQVDHINHNTLDNRRCNLRVASVSQNSMNHRRYANNTSGFTGVSYNSSLRKWLAHICVGGKQLHLGVFDTAEEASEAYQDAAKMYFGEFCYNEKDALGLLAV